MARRKFVCGNWKMHKTGQEALQLVKDLVQRLSGASAQVGIAPPFTAVAQVKWALSQARSPLQLFGQNCHHEKQGAFTGEVSALMLKDAGCDGVILGHSERRQLFGETDEGVARKVKAALAEGLHPIVCVGETLQEREAGRTWEVVSRQMRAGLAGLDTGAVQKLTIAYEPVWAIGTGRNATAAQAQEVHGQIRGLLRELGGAAAADAVRIQYGGSVKPDNAAELLGQPDVDGALVGGASLKAEDFAKIVEAAR
ncbi:MAG: triose-phosphate isomerase [Deltaproteobacteria bacterium]|nr:MAG: triose-phosphate isomerase [Deltaproteobacteria bacterium]TMB30171.1 MAG: triose-phosphate isomerase [Deltaproteobacteria bacterium]TMB36849.1 MAG: triose-phosphate isomerase [Deltaproteobacteria bacterium]